MTACLRCDGSGKEPTWIHVNDGTMTCPTCFSAGSISVIKVTRELRAQLAAQTKRVELLERVARKAIEMADIWGWTADLQCEQELLDALDREGEGHNG